MTVLAPFQISIWLLAGTPKPDQRSYLKSQAVYGRSSDQPLVREPLSGDAINEAVQPLKGVALNIALVEAEGELVNVTMQARLALRRRPKRARWSPWRRTQVVEWTIAISVVLVVAITIARGVIR